MPPSTLVAKFPGSTYATAATNAGPISPTTRCRIRPGAGGEAAGDGAAAGSEALSGFGACGTGFTAPAFGVVDGREDTAWTPAAVRRTGPRMRSDHRVTYTLCCTASIHYRN
ncbi:hypothetical protein Skr01_11350 [Sphaerisporangium krabiense]|nr:hypothetical protein Skr01_11350 [Sphaerisporangium krabiense]